MQDAPIALDGSGAGRILPWLIGCLVYLAVLAAAAAGAADARLAAAGREPAFLSVTLPGSTDTGRVMADAALALALLKASPGVTFAALASGADGAGPIEPWLGADDARVPAPHAIDVAYDPMAERDPAPIVGGLRALVPGARIDAVETEASVTLVNAGTERRLATAFGAGLLLAVVAVAGALTRLTFRAQVATVDLVRVLGAGEAWLARQFERGAVNATLKAGFAGWALALATLASVASWPGLPLAAVTPRLRTVDGILLLLVPVLALLATILAARVTTRLCLGRLT
jgi:cell division transport system permease protein